MWETSAHFFLKKKINDEKKKYNEKLIATNLFQPKELKKKNNTVIN